MFEKSSEDNLIILAAQGDLGTTSYVNGVAVGVRMKRITSRKLFKLLPGLQDPYKIQTHLFLLDVGSRGFGKNIFIYVPALGVPI